MPLEPFTVKGKTAPINAQIVGAARGRRVEAHDSAMPLIGRDDEIATMRDALAAAHRAQGRIIEAGGRARHRQVEAGGGRGRPSTTVCAGSPIEAGRYSLATPYFALRRGLREAMGLTVDTPADEVEGALGSIVEASPPTSSHGSL